MLKIISSIVVLIGLTALGIHFWIGATAGDGASMLWLVAVASGFLGFMALVMRPWLWVRSLLWLGTLAVASLLVDQIAYVAWHDRFEGFVDGLRQDVERGAPDLAQEMRLRPTSLRIEPGQALLFTFEPPLLAWTYHLDAASPRGHAVVARWHRLLARATSGTEVDPIAASIIEPHQAFAVSVASSADELACRADREAQWMVSVEAERSPHS